MANQNRIQLHVVMFNAALELSKSKSILPPPTIVFAGNRSDSEHNKITVLHTQTNNYFLRFRPLQ
jgi:hypothetical protein